MVRPPTDATQRAAHEPLFDVHPATGASIEVFYADRTLETFGRCGAGWFWCSRRRGFSAEGAPAGPFATRMQRIGTPLHQTAGACRSLPVRKPGRTHRRRVLGTYL